VQDNQEMPAPQTFVSRNRKYCGFLMIPLPGKLRPQFAVLFAAAYGPAGPVDELSASNLEYGENFNVIPSVDPTGYGYALALEKGDQ